MHAFNGEESKARIGQRVPVQTAQAYPFGVQTGTPQPGQGAFPTGGFPVINYEPTGLTLTFTPQVFPNLDVQVKMNIESKDVLGADTLTPTFTERTITGTARVQNNRTMLLASVSQDVETKGRRGLPFLGGLPIVGRLFTSPTRRQSSGRYRHRGHATSAARAGADSARRRDASERYFAVADDGFARSYAARELSRGTDTRGAPDTKRSERSVA